MGVEDAGATQALVQLAVRQTETTEQVDGVEVDFTIFFECGDRSAITPLSQSMVDAATSGTLAANLADRQVVPSGDALMIVKPDGSVIPPEQMTAGMLSVSMMEEVIRWDDPTPTPTPTPYPSPVPTPTIDDTPFVYNMPDMPPPTPS